MTSLTNGNAPRGLSGLRRKWDRRAIIWDHHGSPGLEAVTKAVLDQAHARAGSNVVDLGSGTGQLSLPLARGGSRVTAVDLSPAMIARLLQKADLDQLDHLHGVVCPIEEFDVRPSSVDLVVSNYTLHHLRDSQKFALLGAAARWLRPGGRVVVGDMMFGRGVTARDRAIIADKFVTLARRGPGGWWRLAKNVSRFTFRLQERPATIESWCQWFDDAGFRQVTVVPVVAEAVVISALRP